MIAYNSITIANVADGANFRTFTTNYEVYQSTIEDWAQSTERDWDVKESTSDIRAGDTVLFQCYNSSKSGYSYVIATVLSVLGDNSLSAKSIGLIDKGEQGVDGDKIEYVYYRSETEQTNLDEPLYESGSLPDGWTASPQGITSQYKYEYVSVRTKNGNEDWTGFSNPVIWSKWGEKGQDGDGVSYKYYLKNDATPPSYLASDAKWADDPTGVSASNQYEYVVQVKTASATLAKKIDTHLRNFPQSGSGSWEYYGTIGHQENWTTGTAYDNSHIGVGDFAYVVGKVSSDEEPKRDAKIYGKVIDIVENHIRMTSVALAIGSEEETVLTVPSSAALWAKWGEKGDKGDTGRGIDYEVTLYYAVQSANGNPTKPDTPDTQPETAEHWKDKIPSEWSGNDIYIFKTTKQIWNNGDITYTTPTLMSQIEAATIAANDSGKSISDWCVDNDVTLIDGSMIATGSITAEHIETGVLQAEYIQSSNYSYGSLDSLVFTPREDGATYKVGLVQDRIVEKITIPSVYNGKLVTEIDKDSFAYGKDIIKTLAISATITAIPFGFLDGYSVLEELHIPVHNELLEGTTVGPFFGNWFGMEDDESEKLPPSSLLRVYLLGRNDSNKIPNNYFSLYDRSGSFDVYLTRTITKLANYAFSTYNGKNIYHYGQFEQTSFNNKSLTKIEEQYVFPLFGKVVNGFRVSSLDCEPMINSPHFKVSQEGEIEAAMISGGGYSEVDDITITVDDTHFVSIQGYNNTIADSHPAFDTDVSLTFNSTYNYGYSPTLYTFKFDVASLVDKIGSDAKTSLKAIGDTVQLVYACQNLSQHPSIPRFYILCNIYEQGFDTDDENLYILKLQPTTDYSFTLRINSADLPNISSGSLDYNFNKCLVRFSYEGTEILGSVSSQGSVINFVKDNSPYIRFPNFELTESQCFINDGVLQIKTQDDYLIQIGKQASGLVVREPVQLHEAFFNYPCIGVRKKVYDAEENETTKQENELINLETSTLLGSWKLESGAEVTSDLRKKHSVQAQPEIYSEVFDRLEPVIFKYNNGTSDRYHTGFVAQSVEQAVLDAGLTTQDFAAICYRDNGGMKDEYGIRYEELVSMCVYEIQKLKSRVSELENKLNTMQNN